MPQTAIPYFIPVIAFKTISYVLLNQLLTLPITAVSGKFLNRFSCTPKYVDLVIFMPYFMKAIYFRLLFSCRSQNLSLTVGLIDCPRYLEQNKVCTTDNIHGYWNTAAVGWFMNLNCSYHNEFIIST